MAIYELEDGRLVMDEDEFRAFESNCANVIINMLPRSTKPDDVNPRDLARLVLAHFHDRRLALDA